MTPGTAGSGGEPSGGSTGNRTVRRVLCLMLLVGGLVGCGSDSVPPPRPTATLKPEQLNVCALLSQAEAGQLLGNQVSAGARVAAVTGPNCKWTAVTSPLLSVVVEQSQADLFDASVENTPTPAPDPNFTVTKVSGVGNQAFYFTSEGETILEVRSGTFYFTVGVNGSNGSDPSAEKQCALLVIDHLGPVD